MDDFDRAAVLAVLEQNAARATKKAAAILEYPRRGKTGIQPTKAPQTAPKQDGVQRLVDIEQKKAEGKGRGYERWATMHNLKQMARDAECVSGIRLHFPGAVGSRRDTAYQEMRQTSGKLKHWKRSCKGKRSCSGRYLPTPRPSPPRRAESAEIRESPRRIPAGT